MSSNDLAIGILKDYIYEFSDHIYTPWQKKEFQYETYSIWAAKELLVELSKNKNLPPLFVLERFRDKMDDYACLNKKNSFIFSVAKDTAEYLIDQLITCNFK